MQSGAWLLTGSDVESKFTYENLQKYLENEFSTARVSPSSSSVASDKENEEVTCLYNKPHRKRQSELLSSPPRHSPSQATNPYQYLVLKNPPAEYSKGTRNVESLMPNWMVRKRKSQPELGTSAVQQPLPSKSSPTSAERYSPPKLKSSASAKTAHLIDNHAIQQHRPQPAASALQNQNQSPRNRVDHHIEKDDSFYSVSSNYSNASDDFEYVILRVPTTARSILNDTAGNHGSNYTTQAHDNNQITAKHLSSSEAENLIAAIRSTKSSPVDPVVQVRHGTPPHDKSITCSPNWMPDNSGQYEYLILKTPTMKQSTSTVTTQNLTSDIHSSGVRRNPNRKPINTQQTRRSDSPQSFHSSTSNTTSTFASDFSRPISGSSMSTTSSPSYTSTTNKPYMNHSRNSSANHDEDFYQKPHEFSPPLRPRHNSMATASTAALEPKLHNEFGRNSGVAPAVHSSYKEQEQATNSPRDKPMTHHPKQKLRRTLSTNTSLRSGDESFKLSTEELSLYQQNHMFGQSTFWNPRFDGDPAAYAKKGIGRKVKEILSPRKAKLEGAMKDQHQLEKGWSVARPMTPPHVQLSVNKSGRVNPFKILKNTWDIADDDSRLEFSESEFTQIDAYAAQVKQRGPMLTPEVLSIKFLTRPYRRNIHKARAIFSWLVQNIGIGAPLEEHLQQRRSSVDESMDPTQDTDWVETAEVVLAKRWCRTSVGMARLFCELAIAAGLEETRMIYGYLRVARDSQEIATLPNGKIKKNHAWCAVKIEGEYRFVDCYLASQFQPINEGIAEDHWFMTRPLEMIYTHLPASKAYQFLDPPIDSEIYFALPYVCVPYFQNNLYLAKFDSSNLELVDDQVCHLDVVIDEGVSCYAEIETRMSLSDEKRLTITKKALAQCLYIGNTRICRIKAVLPPDCRVGWLKIYAGPRYVASGPNAEKLINPYQLAFTYKLTHSGETSYPFEFVQKYHTPQEFYIQEPQCYNLFPLQTYTFKLFSLGGRNQKLALRSPGGRMYKLLYYPQDLSYDGTVTVSEVGIWNLVSLQQNTGGWHSIASWECTA